MDFIDFFLSTEPREELIEILWVEAKDYKDWDENGGKIKELGLSLGTNYFSKTKRFVLNRIKRKEQIEFFRDQEWVANLAFDYLDREKYITRE